MYNLFLPGQLAEHNFDGFICPRCIAFSLPFLSLVPLLLLDLL